MNKTRLQELCHKLHWEPPVYNQRRMGPDHDPRFVASVSVNGWEFDSPDADSRSSKEAHNKAAGVALESLSRISAAVVPSSPATVTAMAQSPSPKSTQTENQVSFKSQLLVYAQKKGIELPKYTTINEVSQKQPLFKSTVTINGQSFESPKFFTSIKQAEHAAAEVALSHLPKEEETPQLVSLDEIPSGINYKTILQEFTMKNKKLLPVYETIKDPKSLIPIFSSTVQVDGLSFKGESAKSKKQAETNAAKVALEHFKDRKQSVSLSSPMRILKREQVLPENDISTPVESPKPLLNPPKIEPKTEPYIDPIIHNANSGFKESPYTRSTEITIEQNATSDYIDQSATSDYVPVSFVEKLNGERGGVELSLLSNRIQIFSPKPNLVLPPGASLLPCRDDSWVAVELDYPNHEGSDGSCIYASMGFN